jgi:hypothetical protein
MKKFLILVFISAFIFLYTHAAQAKPKTKTTYGHNIDGFARLKIKNNTNESLACYVAINGYKVKFRLAAFRESTWHTATDKRFAYRNFSTWCGYLSDHPEYSKYKVF